MKENKYVPNLITFNIIINSYSNLSLLNEALSVINDMKAVDVQPEEIVYNNLMNMYYRFEQQFLLNECSKRLIKNPEFTIALLQHYATQRININRSLVRFLTSSYAIYSYQNYTIIKWLIINYREPDRILLQVVRQFAWNENDPYYLRSIARYFIYKHGNDTDHDMIETRSRESTDSLEKTDMLYLTGVSKDFTIY